MSSGPKHEAGPGSSGGDIATNSTTSDKMDESKLNSSSEQSVLGTPSVRGQLLLEKLRSKSGSYKSFPDLAKSIRSALLDRRFSLDVVEKGILQRSLDLLQEKIPVRSASGMAERLETIGRKIGLKFMAAPVHGCYYLSTEMFYVEINIDTGGNVNEAKIHHIDATQANQPPNTQNCPEIIECLSKGQFNKFIQHLEGLVAVYDLQTSTNAEKSRAWTALTSVEADLENISNLYNRTYRSTSSVYSLLHDTPLGLVHPRKGGLSMSIRYFVSPYDFYDKQTKRDETFEVLTDLDLGQTLTVTLEKSETQCLLPMRSLVSFKKQGLVSEEINAKNSFNLPARFVLLLKNPIALSLEKCREIENLTKFNFYNVNEASPMMQLIVRNASNGQLEASGNRGMFVTLPEQQHCYFLSDSPDFKGVMVKSIPFCHPGNVQHIITALRQQTFFNSIIETCVRVNAIQDLERSIMFEVACTDIHYINITFEHPSKESIQTIQMDLSDLSDLKCKLFDAPGMERICKDETVSKMFKQCVAIPVVMRALVKKGMSLIKPVEQHIKLETADAMNTNNILNGNNHDTIPYLSNMNRNNDAKFGEHATNNLNKENLNNHNNMDISSQSIVKEEPMDFQSSAQHQQQNSTGSLNAHGPQDVTSGPEASTRFPSFVNSQTFSETSNDSSCGPNTPVFGTQTGRDKLQNSNKKGISIKSETNKGLVTKTESDIEPEFMLTKSSMKFVIPELTKGKEIKKESSMNIKPSFSITPVNSSDSTVRTMASGSNKKSGGIEIIPLGDRSGSLAAAAGHSGSSSKIRDIRRSLSEDDKRRMEKKKSSGGSSSKKRKHESGMSSSSSSMKKKFDDGSFRTTVASNKMGGKSSSNAATGLTISKNKLASVIDRLAQNSAETGIEILPATSGSNSKPISQPQKNSLKLTIKTPGKFPSPSSSPNNSSRSRSAFSSPSNKISISKHKSHSGGGGHHSSSSSSKHSSHKTSKSSSSSSKRASTGGSNSSSSSSSSNQKERDEEVKKLLGGGKLNKTFQIPKITKASSPLTTPTTMSKPSESASSSSTPISSSASRNSGSPKYSSISPKHPPMQQPQVPSSPNYVGGGTVTPPNISPKHSYSAPSSVAGLNRSSPLHPNASPKIRTPSASPTHSGMKYPLPGASPISAQPPPMKPDEALEEMFGK